MIIELPILESIKDSQAQHGLKYENYRRYRSYCSRRLYRIRRSLNVHQGIASSAKARHQRAKKLLDINNSMVLEAGEKDPEYGERMLLIPLCLAERAWSYAMQLKQETSEHPRKRFHLIRRLKRAADHAQRFKTLCHDPESPCTDRTKRESIAYADYVTGLYKLERELWAEAKEHLDNALTIYYTLSISIRKDDVLEHYRQRIDELRASLRYCAFNLGDQGSVKSAKVKLPATLQFHDIAFKHAVKAEQEEALVKKQESEKLKAKAKSKVAEEASSVKPAAKTDPTSSTQQAKAPADGRKKTPVKLEKPVEEDEEEDEKFEETQEGPVDDSENEDSEDESEGDDNQQQSRIGGVTGLVKGWLGGAWS